MNEPPIAAVPAVVLDTNVVLDWLVFCDPAIEPLAASIIGRSVRWLHCQPLRAEFDTVLARRAVTRWQPGREAVAQAWQRWGQAADAPPCGAVAVLPCRDPDDQVFVDFALARSARWLVTRDRDLLALAHRARRRGLDIVEPRRWPAHYSP